MSVATTPEIDSTAGVTPRSPWRLVAVTALPAFQLAVTFQDGTQGIVDLSSVCTSKNTGVFAELANPVTFEQVRLVLGVATWPNGADLDPLWMYDEVRAGKTWSVPI